MLAALPYFSISHFDLGIKIQHFGMIVAAGVLIGASVMRRMSDRYGVDDDDLRKLTGWVVVTGFLGAHIFDVLAYQQDKLKEDPIILLKVWEGIASYGGFLGGAMGFAFFMWWKRLTPGMWADVTTVGLLVAFSIGRIACTLVHDHIGRATQFAMGFDYPVGALKERRIYEAVQATAEASGQDPGGALIRAHNLGLYELLYLIPVNALILWLAFNKKRRFAAGFITVITGFLYAPVRFFLEYLRLNEPDPRYAGFTFAQWCSIAATLVAAYVGIRLLKMGAPAPLAAELGGRPGGRKATLAALAAEKEKGAKKDTKKDGKKQEKAEKKEEKQEKVEAKVEKVEAKVESKREPKPEPKAEPKPEPPKAEAPKAEAPKVEPPKVEPPKPEPPKQQHQGKRKNKHKGGGPKPTPPVQAKAVTPEPPKPGEPKPEEPPKPGELPKPEPPKPEEPKPEQPKPEPPKPEISPEPPKPEQPKPEPPKPEMPATEPKPEIPAPSTTPEIPAAPSTPAPTPGTPEPIASAKPEDKSVDDDW